jgi:cell wall-associated NlpC family hydrolase
MAAEERPGDVALFRIAGQPCHCALVVTAGKMLHTMTGHDSVVESYKIKRWAPRLLGFYRWEAAA